MPHKEIGFNEKNEKIEVLCDEETGCPIDEKITCSNCPKAYCCTWIN